MRSYKVWLEGERRVRPILVFADRLQRARVLGFNQYWSSVAYFNWIDLKARWLKDLPTHLREMHHGGEQVISSPPVCVHCGAWGQPAVDERICIECYETHGDPDEVDDESD